MESKINVATNWDGMQSDDMQNELITNASAATTAQDDTETIGQSIVAITSEHYWGKGKDAETALEQCRKAGASGSQNILIYAYCGAVEKLKEIAVNGFGDIEYPQGVTSIRVGMIKMNVNQPKFKK